MKNVLYFLISLVFLINSSCKAQQVVQTTADVPKLKTNEQQFINKPLKLLLKEIKPEIKTAWVTNEEGYSYFSFRFTTLEEQKWNIGTKEDKIVLYVYVNGQVDWDYEKRPKGQELNWTKEDLEKYGNLTAIRIKIGGKY
ncbi:hypothetical protein [Flavobacterium sp.]|jgi:protoporphyrinogen oxidase|uniref:hypothetical protein n=1 Tax=Flavobacterium sp. TaxID=239 RepID=UPI0022C662B2|nr:hypothetical protein [Flavobacterium sp.]MCZ8228051.1 hypothetical protein [Flavobacterium sp.]